MKPSARWEDDRIYLGHTRDAIREIEGIRRIGRERSIADQLRQNAVIRKLEITGEAVKQFGDATKQGRPTISWTRIAGNARPRIKLIPTSCPSVGHPDGR